MSRGTEARIDLGALQHNLKEVRRLAPNQKVLAMVKANAYGHGLRRIAKTLIDAEGFGVASLDEAIALREVGIKQSIMVMPGFFSESELSLFSQYNISVVVHEIEQLEILEKYPINTALSVWLKLDTGMHRLGFSPDKFRKVYHRLNKLSWVKKPLGIMTHLADADNSDRAFTLEQLNVFFETTENLVSIKSICNSAAIFTYPEAHFDWVRPGIMLYGVSPFANKTGGDLNLKPVMTLYSRLIAVKELQKGDAVGYGCSWRCPEKMRIGVVAAGYGDGYPRHANFGTPVLVNGKICPLIGRVSMDMITVDLRSQLNARVGDKVILWGEGLPVEHVAFPATTIGYELICNVHNRVKFINV